MRYFILLVFLILLAGCGSTKTTTEGSQKATSYETITAPIVEKEFYNKAGKATGIMEYYVQRSVQDYYIKFCESEVDRKELEQALSKVEGPIQQLTLTIEILEGEWDSCDGNPVQSRIGSYVVIKKIVE